MSRAADSLTSQDTPGYDVSTLPQKQKPPPYSAAPVIYLPTKTETACIYQPDYVNKDFWDMEPSDKIQDKRVKRLFVRKVSIIMALQLLFAVSVICVVLFSEGEVMQRLLCITSFITFILVSSLLSYCDLFRKRYPWNTMGLVVVTLSVSHMVGSIASFQDITAVMMTMGATLAISSAIIAFFAHTSDFTVWSGVLLMLNVDMIMFAFLHLLLLFYH